MHKIWVIALPPPNFGKPLRSQCGADVVAFRTLSGTGFGGRNQLLPVYHKRVLNARLRIVVRRRLAVTFSYKDYADGSKVKTMTLAATKFLRRFCLCIFPNGFRKIRHFGILSSRNKKRLKELQTKMLPTEPKKDAIVYIQPCFSPKICPCCCTSEMHVIMRFGAHAPPVQNMLDALKKPKNNTIHVINPLNPSYNGRLSYCLKITRLNPKVNHSAKRWESETKTKHQKPENAKKTLKKTQK